MNLKSKIWNKESVIFLFFLALSCVFWIFQTLNEVYEEELLVPIEVVNVPGNVVIMSDLPEALQVTLRDKGSTLLTYMYTKKFNSVKIDFDTYANSSGHVTLPEDEVLKQVSNQLLAGTQLVSMKPERIEFYYNYGLHKRVPIVLRGEVQTGKLFNISEIKLSNDSATVYASQEVLDTITAAYTRVLNLDNLTDTTKVKAEINPIKGTKFVPQLVEVEFCVDRLVEKSVEVAIKPMNFPSDKQLITFPAVAKVTFQVSMGLFRQITGESFTVTVDYEDLTKQPSQKCPLSLKTVPKGVFHPKISPASVEYIIEDIGPVPEVKQSQEKE